MIEELIELFLLGLMGTVFIGMIGLFIFLLVECSPYLLYIAGGTAFVLTVGWCIKHYDDFVALFSKPVQPDLFKFPKASYGNETLDGLAYFEKKYGMTTVQFMGFVYKDLIPHGMNNLDYIEWLAMAVALGTFKDSTEEEL